jgi:replicative DNA helicase Mcm
MTSALDDITGYTLSESKFYTSNFKSPSDITDTYDNVKVINVSECLRLHTGNVNVQGTITSMSNLYKMIKSVTIECIACEKNKKVGFQIPQYYPVNLTNQRCDNCNKNMRSIEEKNEYANAVSIEIQDFDTFSDIEKLSCILFDDNTLNVQVGSKVIISGSMQVIHIKNRKSIPYLYSTSIHYENKEKLVLSQQDIVSIIKLRKIKGDKVIETLSEMFAPSIIGMNIIKKGMLLTAVSTSEDNFLNGNRDRIHSLIVGNPGIGKSKLIREAIKLVANSRYESSQHASGKSLTAIVSKENEDCHLRLGPIPLARGSICVLNEIGRINVEDQGFLLDVMEEGEFTINKYGINAKIKSPTVIIASANPVGSTWSPNAKNYDNEKINMNDIPLLQPVKDRFDLKFILKDLESEQELQNYANEKTKQYKEKIPDYYQYLRRYIQYVKQLNPILTEEARLMLKEYYVNLTISLSKSNPTFGSKRILETLIRIAKSISKLKLKSEIDKMDAKEAMEFYNAVIYQYLDSTVLIPDDPKSIAISEFTKILKESHFAHSLEELAKIACKKNEYVKSYLLGNVNNKTNNLDHLLKIEKNRKLRSVYDLLIENTNVKRVNEKPIALQWINSNLLSDTTDTYDMKAESKTKINHEKNDDYKIKTSVMSDRSDTTPNNHFNYYSFECYYCDKLPSTTNEEEYLKHVVLNHNNKPAYPSLPDLEKNNLKPQGKKWEI